MSTVDLGPVPLDTPLELPGTADTEALGERLAAGLGAGDLVVLAGPLGAGKTALVRGLARGLGVAGPVTSPTFVIAREHRPAARRQRGAAGARRRLPARHRRRRRRRARRPRPRHGPRRRRRRRRVGEGVAERLAARHLLVRLDRRPDDVRVAIVHRIEAGSHRDLGTGPRRPRPARDRGSDLRLGRHPDALEDRRCPRRLARVRRRAARRRRRRARGRGRTAAARGGSRPLGRGPRGAPCASRSRRSSGTLRRTTTRQPSTPTATSGCTPPTPTPRPPRCSLRCGHGGCGWASSRRRRGPPLARGVAAPRRRARPVRGMCVEQRPGVDQTAPRGVPGRARRRRRRRPGPLRLRR